MMQTQYHGGIDQALLLHFAARYIWWKKPSEAVHYPDRVIAQVMKIGDFDDVLELVAAAGEDRLREVVQHAEAGQFDERSWAYWHYRLGLAKLEQVPALPARRFQ
ncbi:hypothetical protein [Achromobacter xylosoxidans]|uniref:hypothetical protein n=1 Tax=Alcaligenes xylosoxydans xylosoxydans TaxID=85698 RepID=UPI001F204F90|nr:hypothetical protein [Achromobacter xylosoxidans]